MDEQFADGVLRTLDRVPGKLVDFGRALEEAQGDLDWPYFLTKPYKWSAEFAAWQTAGMPSGEGDDGWNEFCDHIGAL
jgi:hypothetical protein